jgi:hypothetical protein
MHETNLDQLVKPFEAQFAHLLSGAHSLGTPEGCWEGSMHLLPIHPRKLKPGVRNRCPRGCPSLSRYPHAPRSLQTQCP